MVKAKHGEPFLTPREVAGLIHLRPRTVIALARERQLAHIKLGRFYRFLRGDVDAFMLIHHVARDRHFDWRSDELRDQQPAGDAA